MNNTDNQASLHDNGITDTVHYLPDSYQKYPPPLSSPNMGSFGYLPTQSLEEVLIFIKYNIMRNIASRIY